MLRLHFCKNMDGHYQTNYNEYRVKLSEWIDNSIRDNSWDDFVDLHIDTIDPFLKNPIYWTDYSILLYDITLDLLNDKLYNCLLVIPLRYSEFCLSSQSLNLDQLKSELDLTPPSLYLFPKGHQSYIQTINDATMIEGLSKEVGFNVFLRQELEEGEYFRCLYFFGRV
jgi:hypothetical protein